MRFVLTSCTLAATLCGFSATPLCAQAVETESQTEEITADDGAQLDGESEPSEPEETDSAVPDSDTEGKTTSAKTQSSDSEAQSEALKPRFQMRLKSLSELSAALDRAALGPLVYHMARVISEAHQQEQDGKSEAYVRTLLEMARDWPDCETDVAVFGPDVQGRPRLAKRVYLPIGQVHDLVQDMLQDERLEEFFEGAELAANQGRFVLRVNGEAFAYLTSEGSNATVMATHEDLTLPKEIFRGTDGEGEPLLAAKLVLEKTEKDSGETFFSKLSLIHSIDYTLRSQADGNWLGEFRVNWPPAVGLALKPVISRTKQTFFVPEEAFAGAVVKIAGTSASLDQIVGFEEDGPLASRASDDLAVTLLPGTGLMPIPDIVFQCRLSDTDDLVEDTDELIKELNEEAEERDHDPDWHHERMRNRDVFWSENSLETQTIMPFIFRPVFFVQSGKDGKGRDRDFLVVGLTTTNPIDFVDRWLDLERDEESRFIPASPGLNAEVWLNWKEIYDWLVPWVNNAMSSVGPEFVISDSVGEGIEDGTVTMKIKYEGLRIVQNGPVPLGLLSVPGLVSASMQEKSGTDLARERLAARRLRLLHYHSTLFHQDIGRWPSQVAELDGYIDFAGNPHLLKLESSPKKKWSEFFEDLFELDDDEDEDDEDEDEDEEMYASIDDSLYVVSWDSADRWSLGFEEDKFEHLEQLYIDEAGKIHRLAKDKSADKEPADGSDNAEEAEPNEVATSAPE